MSYVCWRDDCRTSSPAGPASIIKLSCYHDNHGYDISLDGECTLSTPGYTFLLLDDGTGERMIVLVLDDLDAADVVYGGWHKVPISR